LSVPYPESRAAIEESYHSPLRRLWLRVLARLMEWLTDLQPKQLNYSDVTPQLAVGGAFRRRQIKRLKQRGVTAVVDCRLEAEDDSQALSSVGIKFLHVPTPDRHGFTFTQMQQGVDWVVDHLEGGGKAFLHCEHGVGRGPLMACAVLVAQGSTAPEALRTVRKARWQALPNDRQLAALVDFERSWRNRGSAGAVNEAAALHDSPNGLGHTQPAHVGDDVASA
jgi:protein-tyrosine phosphatase